ncbi:hypothetical protein RND81_10G228100 [Saponaria officinalis]|uniref:Uncharacterized protein n=1 Tax=Saponaria officinalis TaxID=3572 RepID=A0AAW1I614_SAPOF
MATSSDNISTPKIMVKLIINKETGKLLFAEAGKDFVDFLFSIPSLPIGAFLGLINDDMDRHLVSEGALVNLYKTIDNLDARYMQPQFSEQCNKQTLLFPTTPTNIRTRLQSSRVTNPYKFSANPAHYNMYIAATNALANSSNVMKNDFTGYVRGTTTYMIMDDLNVEPMSIVSSVSFLHRFGALDVNKLEEREVVVGDDEVTIFISFS